MHWSTTGINLVRISEIYTLSTEFDILVTFGMFSSEKVWKIEFPTVPSAYMHS